MHCYGLHYTHRFVNLRTTNFELKKYHICHQDKFKKKKLVRAVITFNTVFIDILKQFNPENIVSKDSEYLQGVGKLENSIH